MHMSLPRRAAATVLLLAVCVLTTGTAQTALKNGDVFDSIKYTSSTTYDANAKLKDETSYSSMVLWKGCTVSSKVTVKGTFNTAKTFATSLYLMVEKATFSGPGQFDFFDLPPNSYVHAVGTKATAVTDTIYYIRPTTMTNNITAFIDDSTVSYESGNVMFVDLEVPIGSPYIVTHMRNAKLTNTYAIFQTTTCNDGSTIFLEKVTCTSCRYDLTWLNEVNSISRQSALILKEITIIGHTRPTRDGLIVTGDSVEVDATSVLAMIDVDLTDNFRAATPLRLFYETSLSGAGVIVLLRIKMGSSGLDDIQPANNKNFWVVAMQTSSREMTTAELRSAKFNVNANNVIRWDGTGANNQCVQAGLALPGTATYKLVNGKCEATCPQGNYLPPACTPRAVCTGVPNCQACYAHPKTLCLECVPHTEAINSDTVCKCPIRECVTCPTESLCSECAKDHKYSAADNSCFHCTIDKCTLCREDGKCSTCSAGYKLYNNQCIACTIDKCESCKVAGSCAECIADHKPTSDGKSCIQCTIPFCKECSAAGVCRSCDEGYWLDNNKCIRCSIDVQKCQKCKTDGVCSECLADHKPANEGKQCFHCTIPFCKECSADGVCGGCDEGYSLTENKCVRCSIDVGNCKSCKTDGICSECIADHKPANEGKKCFHCTVPGCQECSADDVCGVCEGGFTFIPSFNIPTESKCVRCSIDVDKCKVCEVNSVCSECIADHKTANDGSDCFHCTIPGCKECRSDGVCNVCNDGYSLVESEDVPTDNKCVACSSDVPKCHACKAEGICSECVPDHKPTNEGKNCFHCTIANCEECTADGICASCDDGYSLVESETIPTDNKCVRCSIDVPHCATCTTESVCSECIPDYKVSYNGLRCTLCSIDKCQTCDLPDVCAVCKGGMAVNDEGQCTPCAIEDCTYCSDINTCAACTCGLVPSHDGNTCVSCSASNCRYCDPSGGGTTCAECQDGYQVSSDDTCTKIVLPKLVVFAIVVTASVVLMTAIVVAYILFLRHMARQRQLVADAEERRKNRQVQGNAGRQRMEIAVLDLGDIEGAASGVRDTMK